MILFQIDALYILTCCAIHTHVLYSHATDAHDSLFSAEDAFTDTLFKMFQMLMLGENGVCEDVL